MSEPETDIQIEDGWSEGWSAEPAPENTLEIEDGWAAGWSGEYDDPEPVEEPPGLIETAGKGLAHGVYGLGESIGTGVEYLGNRVGSEGMAWAGEIVKYFWKDKAEQYSPSASISGKNVWDNPELLKNAEWWVYNISDMAPALASSIIPGAGAAKGAQAIPALAKLAPMIGAGVGGLAGGALEGAQTYNAVLEKGGTEEEAARAGELMTAGASVLNALSVGKVLSKAGTTFKGKVLKHLGAGAWEGFTEGLEEPTEVFSKYFGAYLAGEPLPENLTEDLIQSAKEALTVAPIAAVTGIGGSVMAGNKDKLPSEAEPEKDPDGVVGETNPEDALSNDPEKAARANAENDKILNAVINGEDEYWKQQEDIILGQRTQRVEKNKKANEPPSLFERNQQTIDDMGRWQSRNLDVPQTDERAWKDLEGEEKYWSEQRRLIEEQRKGPSQIQKNQARIDATLSDEEQVTRDRNQAMAGKSDFLQKLDMMQAEVNGSQTRGVNQEKVGQQSETVVFGASSPNWMQNIQEARKKRGEPLLSRNDLNVLFNKTRSGQPLTERQRNQYLDLEQEINTYTGDAGEFVEQEKADEFEHKGFEVYGGQQMPVSNLNTGDVFQGTVNGESGEFTVKSIDENGVATIQGKENHQVDISDSVAVDAVKRSRVEGIGPVSKAELKQEGYDVFPGKKEISVTDLNEGDKIVGTIDGVKDEYTVKGVNDSGEVLFQDGITRRLDMFDEVSVDGIKRGDNARDQEVAPAQSENVSKELAEPYGQAHKEPAKAQAAKDKAQSTAKPKFPTSHKQRIINDIAEGEVRLNGKLSEGRRKPIEGHIEKQKRELEKLEILDVLPNDLDYQRAYDAHRGTSHVPDERAEQEQQGYVQHMESVRDYFLKRIKPEQKEDLKVELERYKQGYLNKYGAVLDAKSRTMSSMISGPARFPMARNRKALDVEQKRYEEFHAWDKKAQNAIKRNLDLTGVISSDDPKAIDKLKEKLAGLEKTHQMMKDANKIARTKKKTDEQKIKELVDLGLTKETAKEILTPNYAGKIGFPSYSLSNNNANIKRTKDRIAELEKQVGDKTTEFEFDGGQIIDNVEDNRVQIFHDEKPSDEIRKELKTIGFRWAPSVGSWQRKRSPLALRLAKDLVGIEKDQVNYSTSADLTDQSPAQGITLDQIKSQYPGQQTTANKDGSLSIRFQNGKGVRIKTVEHIGGDDCRVTVQSGRMAKNGVILGKYQDGEITLNENMAGLETAIHENLHLLVDLGILNKLDLAVIDNHRKKLVEAGEYRYEIQVDTEENQANTLAQLINDRDKYRNRSVLHRVIQKVADFLDALVNIGRQSARKLAREYESGAIYSREAINAPKKGVPNMSVSSDRIDGDSFSVPDNSTLSEDFQYNVIDILSPVSKVYKAIKKSIPEKADFRLKEQLRVSKAKGDINEAEKKFFEPIKRLIGIHKLTVADVDEFLYARHAPEANVRLRLTNARYYLNKLANAQKGSRLKNQIKVIDAKFELEGIPTADVQAAYKTILEQELRKAESEKELKVKEDWEKFSEKPSGMTDKEAAEFSKKWSENKAMPKIARLFDQMNDEGLKISHEAGRLSHEEYEAVKGTFDYYAPLHREGNETKRAFMGIGMGVTNLGTDVKARGGSTKRAVHLLANAMVNHEKNIINARKAEVARAFLEFVKMNPNKNFWEFEETKTKVAYDSKGNIRRIVTFNIEPHQVRVKADGKTHIISANPGNVHAMRILDIIQGNQHKAAPIIGALSMFNRILASVNTTLNPEFIISNFARDLQTAALNLEDTEVAKMRKQIFKSLPNSIKGLYSYVRGDGSHEWAKIAKQYESSGAKIGWIDYGRDIESKVKKLESQIDLHRDGHTTKKSIKKFFTVVEDYNSIAENAVRLATFKAGIDAGMSEAKAAIMAKGLTVNFNQKGAQGTVINSLYLFANAGIQGSTRIIKTLKNNPRRMAKVLGGATATAAGLAMANSIIGGEDDDGNNYYDQIDDHLKARNIIFMIPGTNGKFAKIPLPWGYNVFWALGTEIGDAIVKDDYQPLEGVSRMIATTMDAFNPLQSASIAQTLSPTIGDPFVQVAENKTFFGGPLMPEGNPFSKTPTPDSERYWNSVRPISKGIATGVNWLTGGNKIKPGLMDVSPETLDLVFDTFTGGAGRFAADLFLFPVRSVTGDLTLPDVPMARRLLGSKSEYKISSDYRKNITHVFRLKEQAEEYPERIKELRQDKTFYLLGLAKKSEKSIKKFRNFLKKTKSPEVKSRLEKQIEKTQQAFNKAFIIRRGE